MLYCLAKWDLYFGKGLSVIEAEINRKIRQQQPISTQEDVLTSNIFGLLSLVDMYLLKILSHAKPIHPDADIKNFIGKGSIDGKIEFWKIFNNQNDKNGKTRDEPDIYFKMRNGNKIIVEVKYYSGESSENQLEDYSHHCDALIYLTPDNKIAAETIEKYANNKKIFWLSWEQFHIAAELAKTDSEGLEQKILDMVCRYLEHKNLKYWNGWETDMERQIFSCLFYGKEYFHGLGGYINIARTKFYQEVEK